MIIIRIRCIIIIIDKNVVGINIEVVIGIIIKSNIRACCLSIRKCKGT